MFPARITENGPDSREVKQRITKRLASSLRALQIRYVTTDDTVTSDDDDANRLCVALEAVFIHGIKAKFIKSQTERRTGRNKGRHAPLPQPAFWPLLKAITHRNVITDLEKVGYINTDVGRCRSWLRLALNDSLIECYFISLQREKAWLQEYYQPFALLLDAEGCDVVLSYLQGFATLTFSLSYKSSVLNEWTATPLSLSGLWWDEAEHSEPRRRKSLDSVSQSSSSDDTTSSMINENKCHLQTSSPRTDTNSSSSQLSSSLGSDGQLQTSGATSPIHLGPSVHLSGDEEDTKESDRLSSEDLEFGLSSVSVPHTTVTEAKSETKKMTPGDLNCQDKYGFTQNDLPESHVTGSKDHNDTFVDHKRDRLAKQVDSESPLGLQPTPIESFFQDNCIQIDTKHLSKRHSCKKVPAFENDTNLIADSSSTAMLPVINNKPEKPQHLPPASQKEDQENMQQILHESVSSQIPKSQGSSQKDTEQTSVSSGSLFAASEALPQEDTQHSLDHSSELPKSRSWISEEDFQRVSTPGDQSKPGDMYPSQPPNNSSDERLNQAFNVIHRRQIGLTNPFRGLLMLGYLERRNTLGLYKSYYCELSPYEFRLYLKGDDRILFENCSLLRCESVGAAQSDGRFELHFPVKKLFLRAPSKGEAQDWVDRIQEALQSLRPRQEESWEILKYPESPQTISEKKMWPPGEDKTTSLGTEGFDWVSPIDVEPDALKESILYMKMHKKWTRCIFSLSEKMLKCFLPKASEKLLHGTFSMDIVKDILPDSSLGNASCFRLVTSKGSLQLQAESPLEAKTWRELVRAAFLESADESLIIGTVNFPIKSHIREHPLFQHLLHIPTEGGLDAQNFKCSGCSKQIGFHFGKAKLCGYSGLYYCELCHKDEESIIPSRIIHNWDLSKRPVSRAALNFLNMVHTEPLMNVNSLNARLYHHSQSMYDISRHREKLRLLGEYLVTCRSGAWQEMSKSLENRNYLMDCADMYSVYDLRQIADGEFGSFLETLMQFASRHVYNCDLCSQRGFICQFCDQDDIIYPFEFDTTTRCGDCKAVFHRPCALQGLECPRCVRRKKYHNQFNI
ncbi:pleckstrin homology domain-containing family M member 1 [Bombina bombina]|uniref:pleckstrin homology domain-containing family M member 1 n=1 Tax=Bombina bombina TaxID=8345 RepID=UPI00235AAB8A|nr:pleckstrin homology domain-containing family M member 1 [Bombina bombina]